MFYLRPLTSHKGLERRLVDSWKTIDMKDSHPASQDQLKYGDRRNGTEKKSFCSLQDAETNPQIAASRIDLSVQSAPLSLSLAHRKCVT
jgi:hypothetical protein